MKTKTVGASPKAQLAGLLSALAALASALITRWLHADPTLSVVVVGVSTAAFALLGAVVGAPGVVVGGVPVTPSPHSGQHLTPRQNVTGKEPKA